MPGQVNTFANLERILARQSGQATDIEIVNAFRELYTAIRGGAADIRITDLGAAPTDATVQALGIEVFDGQKVAIRSGSNLKLYHRVAGSWLYYVAGP